MGFNSGFKGLTHYRLGGPGTESRWGARFFAPAQTGSGAHPSSCTMGTKFFPGVKAAGVWRWPPTPSSAEVTERVELYLYSWPVRGWTLPYLYLHLCGLTWYQFTHHCITFRYYAVCIINRNTDVAVGNSSSGRTSPYFFSTCQGSCRWDLTVLSSPYLH